MELRKELETIKRIEMPKEMQERIIRNCDRSLEGKHMSFKKVMTIAASLVLCLCVTGVTALAASGKLEGFFKDIRGWNGAVTGTSYEQATHEVEVNITEVSEELVVEVKMLKVEDAPYRYFELLGIKTYEILDNQDNVILKGTASEMMGVFEGKSCISLSVNSLLSGEYKLLVTELVGSSKADQPLVVRGTWECDFTK